MLKEMLVKVEGAIKDYDVDKTVNTLYEIADSYGYVYELLQDNIIDRDLVDDMTSQRLESTGFEGVKIMLDGIHWLNDNYYYIDGYANLHNLTIEHLKAIYDDIKTTLADELELEEE